MLGNKSSVNLSIEVVGQAAEELALDGVLLCKQGQVVAELVVGGDDGAFAVLVKLGAAGAAEDLHDVQDAEIHQGASLGVVDLSALEQNQNDQMKYFFSHLSIINCHT